MSSPYIVEGSGPAINVLGTYNGEKLLKITGEKTYPTSTTYRMTTVSAMGDSEHGVMGAVGLFAFLSPSYQAVPVRSLYPANMSAQEVDQENEQMMLSSQDIAGIVAAEKAGYEVSMTVKIAGAPKDSPNYSHVKKDDIIKKIAYTTHDGTHQEKDITSFGGLLDILNTLPAHTSLSLLLEREGEEIWEELTTQSYQLSDGSTGHGSRLGVYVNIENVDNPVTISYGVEGIGGPSAGMMFTLGIYDELTPDSLGSTAKIAGTGTIDYDGSVGPIGGIAHKMRGARSQGAQYFLAPSSNCDEVRDHVPSGLKIVEVSTIDEAIAAVEKIGQQDISSLPSCKTR